MKRILCLLLALCALVIPVALSSCEKPDFSGIVGGGSSKPPDSGSSDSGNNTGSSEVVVPEPVITADGRIIAPCSPAWTYEEVVIGADTYRIDMTKNYAECLSGDANGSIEGTYKFYNSEKGYVEEVQGTAFLMDSSAYCFSSHDRFSMTENFCRTGETGYLFFYYYDLLQSKLIRISSDTPVRLYLVDGSNYINVFDYGATEVKSSMLLRLCTGSTGIMDIPGFRIYCFKAVPVPLPLPPDGVDPYTYYTDLGYEHGKKDAENGFAYRTSFSSLPGVESALYFQAYENGYDDGFESNGGSYD